MSSALCYVHYHEMARTSSIKIFGKINCKTKEAFDNKRNHPQSKEAKPSKPQEADSVVLSQEQIKFSNKERLYKKPDQAVKSC